MMDPVGKRVLRHALICSFILWAVLAGLAAYGVLLQPRGVAVRRTKETRPNGAVVREVPVWVWASPRG